MENKLLCTPVILPTEDADAPIWEIQPLVAVNSSGNIYLNSRRIGDSKNRHIYLVSDREIKEGDWEIRDGRIARSSSSISTEDAQRLNRHRIEASTDKLLNLPLIPQSWISNVYVPAQGKIDKVCIGLIPIEGAEGIIPPGTIRLNKLGEVIIIPVKESWNREEVKAIYKQFRSENAQCAIIGGPPYWTFDEWFDKNY